MQNRQMIPDGWGSRTVKQFGKVVSGGTPDTNNPAFWNGNIYWITPSEVSCLRSKYAYKTQRMITQEGLVNSSAHLLPANSLIICTRATIGDCCINKVEMCTNQGFKNILVNKGNNVEFLYYLILQNKNEFIRKACGSTFLEISKNDVEKLKFIVPPLKEQEKIAQILATWDSAIEQLTDLIAEKKQQKKAIMQKLLTGKQRLPGFAASWKKEKLSKLCDIETGKKDVNEGNPTGKYPFFTCAKMHTFADTFSYDKEAILIAGNGDVGNCQYYNGKFEAYQRTYILHNFRTNVKLLFQILDAKMSKYASGQKQQGAMPYIKLGTLADFLIDIPSDPAEQTAIADVLMTADAEVDLLQQQLQAITEQKRGLMQKLLTGQIRVKVDKK